jgi:thioredoxin 1
MLRLAARAAARRASARPPACRSAAIRSFAAIADLTSDAEIDAAIAASADRPLLLNFTAAWCGPCRAVKPRIDALAASRASTVTFARVDIDSDAVLASVAAAGVTAVPTFALYRDGARVAEVRGADVAAVEAALAELV